MYDVINSNRDILPKKSNPTPVAVMIILTGVILKSCSSFPRPNNSLKIYTV